VLKWSLYLHAETPRREDKVIWVFRRAGISLSDAVAELAETLIMLESLKEKVTWPVESVSGPKDGNHKGAGSTPLEQWRRQRRWPDSYDRLWQSLMKGTGLNAVSFGAVQQHRPQSVLS
jgi:hypothetical protein